MQNEPRAENKTIKKPFGEDLVYGNIIEEFGAVAFPALHEKYELRKMEKNRSTPYGGSLMYQFYHIRDTRHILYHPKGGLMGHLGPINGLFPTYLVTLINFEKRNFFLRSTIFEILAARRFFLDSTRCHLRFRCNRNA